MTYTPDDFNGDEFRAWLASQYEFHYASESPIESLLAASISLLLPLLNDIAAPTIWPGALLVDQQVAFDKYRVDLCLSIEIHQDNGSAKYIPIMAIECDGHDYHERTKEQAARDKKRDRWFSSQGIRCLRFTGSEIYRKPVECAFEVMQNAQNLLDRGRLAEIMEAELFAEVC